MTSFFSRKPECASARTVRVAVSRILALGLLGSTMANAQTGPTESARDGQLEEIVVTAEKRTESVQDVSAAISVLSGDFLTRNNITAARDLFQQIPNVSLQSNASSSGLQIAIRGIDFSTFSPIGVQPVLIYQDEVPINNPVSSGMFIFDLERVEVLRGPQNTLYGRNTTGGAVNFIARKPRIGGDFGGSADLTIGNFDTHNANVAVDLPTGSTSAMRLSFQTLNNSGYWRNVVSGQDRGESSRWAGRMQWLSQPSDSFTALITAQAGSSRGDGPPRTSAGLRNPANPAAPCAQNLVRLDNLKSPCVNAAGQPNLVNNGDIRSDLNNPIDNVDAYGVSANLRWDTSWGSFTSISSYYYSDFDHWEDCDGSVLTVCNFRQRSEAKQYAQEFRIASSDEQRARWIVGAFLFQEKADYNNGVVVFGGAAVNDVDQENTVISPYFQVNFDVSDRLTAIFGARYLSEEKSGFAQAQQVSGLSGGRPGLPALDYDNPDAFLYGNLTRYRDTAPGSYASDRYSRKWTDWAGRLGLEFRASDDVLLYANAARGVKAGQFPDGPESILRRIFKPTDPETVLAYELGAKATWADGRLITNIAAFKNDYDDQQAQFVGVIAGVGFVSTFFNVAKSEAYGFELEARYAPGNDWFLDLGLGWLNTKVLEDNLAQESNGLARVEIGRQLANAPELTGNLSVRKDFQLQAGNSLSLQLDARYVDERLYDILDTAARRFTTTDPSYVLLGANARLSFGPDGNYSVSLWGKNLTDEIYFMKAQDFDGLNGGASLFPGNPRTFGLSVSAQF
jgi:iron complex outermembrane receptor protein